MDNYVGKRLDGRYEIQDIIGVGGMAVVYKAYDSIDDRIVAVKILKDEYLANEEFRRRFKNESKAIAILSHQNIVKVYDVSFGDKLQYIVMEYIEGITLKEYIQQHSPIDWNEALFFVIQILRALQHAHDKGIVHRDIKPQNIMLLEDGTIKVADFGIARFSRGETRTMTEKAIGSVHYISPEQAKGEMTDEKADIYSVGVVLYEMLTGKLPFEADNAVSVALMQLQAEAALPRSINSSIPVGFEQITIKAMQKNPRDRYQTAAEMLLDLEELKRNPNIKFDYQTYFVDSDPTKYIGKIQEKRTLTNEPDLRVKTQENITPSKTAMVPPASSSEEIAKEMKNVKEAVSVVEQPKKKPNTKTIAIIAGVSAAVLIFVVVLLIVLITTGKIGKKKIEVVSFIGKNYEEEILNNSDYKDYNFEPVYTSASDVEDGVVYDQDPKAGSQMVKGGTIKLTIAKSGEGQVIPDFSGQSYTTAKSTLEAMGFVVNLVSENNTEVAAGTVLRTDPYANTTILAGSTVTVYYAINGNSGKLFKMPDLTGKTLAEATQIITSKGLVLAKTETADSSVKKDYVLNQSPSDGSPVREGDAVVLTISTGIVTAEKTITLPNYGNVSVKVTVDGNTVNTETVDTSLSTKYALKVSGTGSKSSVQVYIDDTLYYEATVDFTKGNPTFTNEKTYTIVHYVDVVGMTESDAISALNAAGYKNVTVEYISSDDDEGTVLTQSPTYASAPHVDQSTSIKLTVSSGLLVPSENSTEGSTNEQ